MSEHCSEREKMPKTGHFFHEKCVKTELFSKSGSSQAAG